MKNWCPLIKKKCVGKKCVSYYDGDGTWGPYWKGDKFVAPKNRIIKCKFFNFIFKTYPTRIEEID